MKTLFILNEPAYGNERSYNGLRLALSLAKAEGQEVRIFLMGDAVTCAKTPQKTPDGYYNVERMLKRVLMTKGRVLLCGTCMDASCMVDADVVEGGLRSTMDELAEATAEADKVLVF